MAELMPANPQPTWPPPPAKFPLGARDIHVWAASLRVSRDHLATFSSTLSPDEQTRAGKFIFERDRNRYIAARGMLRVILARYLRQNPDAIKFTYTDRGKPSIANLPENEPLHFNLAHSDDLAVFAFCRACPVGIDVERLRPIKDIEGIAERFFSPRETAQLKSLSATKRHAGFFNLWTRKEAWLKATGDGIGDLLAEVEVSLLPGEPARLLSLFDDADAAAKWTLHDLAPAPNFKAALAVPCSDLNLHCCSWPDEPLPITTFSSHHEHPR